MVKRDRKSTRLNSSHLVISYAVFCLKKKRRDDRLRGGASSPLPRTIAHSPLSPCRVKCAAGRIAARPGAPAPSSSTTRGTSHYCAAYQPLETLSRAVLRPRSGTRPPGRDRGGRSRAPRGTRKTDSAYGGYRVSIRTRPLGSVFFFFFNNPAPPEIYTLPLPDPFPI